MSIPKPIINLAIFETLSINDKKDEIDLFIPFVALSVSKINKIPFNQEELQQVLLTEFGINAPMAAVDVLLARAKNRGLITVDNHVYLPNFDAIKPWLNAYDRNVSKVNKSISAVAGRFIEFAMKQYSKSLAEDDALDLLYEFLNKNIGDSALISTQKFQDYTGDIKNYKHMTASFIAHVYSSDKGLWVELEELVRAVMLASYLSYADQITSRKDYSNITIYLDTPIILGMLGYSGDGREKALLEMINMLSSYGLALKIFDITLREVEGILCAWMNDLEARRYEKFNPKTLQLLRKRGIDHIALSTHITLLERKIEGCGVNIQKGYKLVERFNCDISALESNIKQNFIGKHVDPRHDADVLNRVNNARSGNKVSSLNQKFSVFVTPNIALVDISRCFFGNADKSIPCAVTDRWLTTMFWFKHPELFSDLPTKILVSSAYGAMFSENGFWKTFADRLENLKNRNSISDEDFVLVRYDSDLLLRVHELSVDRGMTFSDRDVFDLVNEIKGEIEAKGRLELEKSEAVRAVLVEENLQLLMREIRRIEFRAKLVGGVVGIVLFVAVLFSIVHFFPQSIDYSGGSVSFKNGMLTIAYVFLSVASLLSVSPFSKYISRKVLDLSRYDYLLKKCRFSRVIKNQ